MSEANGNGTQKNLHHRGHREHRDRDRRAIEFGLAFLLPKPSMVGPLTLCSLCSLW